VTTSTINPLLPVANTPVEQSGPALRQNFLAAYNDINALFAGGGGGGGGSTVTTIANLVALPIPASGTVAFVSDLVRGGAFVWSALNLSTQVTNDPGQGIYIAPTAAPTGASGAWVRQYSGPSSLAFWGGIGDNATDNARALATFGVWGRRQAALYGGVELYVPPGKYLFDFSTNFPPSTSTTGCNGCFWNLGKFTLHCAGTQWTNIQNDTLAAWPFPTFAQPVRDLGGTSTGYLINQTVQGAQTFTMTTHAEASNFSVGEVIMLASLDVQGYGFPPNCQWFEFVTITGANSSTGVVSITEQIRYQHRADYPDFNGNYQCGKARAWKLSNGGGFAPSNGLGGHFAALVVNWDIDYNIVGPLKVDIPPNAGGFAQTYQSISARRVSTYGWTGPGFSETVSERVVHDDAVLTTQALPDKTVSSLTYRNSVSTVTSGASLGFQNPFDQVLLENCKFPSVSTGTVKNFRAVNCDFNSVGIGFIAYGLANNQEFDNCRIFGWNQTSTPPLLDATGSLVSIDGTNISFSNGVFTILISGVGFWGNVVPGGYLAFVAPSGFPGDIGVMRILSITADATHVFITTDSPFTTVPVWCSPAKFYIFQVMNVEFKGCTGCDQVRNFSEAATKGLRYFERFRLVTAGITASFFDGLFQANGIVNKITVNPINIGGTPGAVLEIDFSTFNSASNFAADAGGMVLKFNVGVAGKRVLTQTSFTGTGGTDTFTLGGGAITALPANRLVGPIINFFQNTYTGTAQQTPVVEIIIEYDCGQVRQELPVQFLHAGATLVGISGLLP
jgi:hypothetical protein